MKKLFCAVVTDSNGDIFESPYIFHVRANSRGQIEEKVMQVITEEYPYHDKELINGLELFILEIEEGDIVEL